METFDPLCLEAQLCFPLYAASREVIKRIQTIRKESGFNITDRINVTITDAKAITDAIDTHRQFICSQVLANSITTGGTDGQEIEIDGVKALIKVEKV